MYWVEKYGVGMSCTKYKASYYTVTMIEIEIATAMEILSQADILFPIDKQSFFDQTWKLQRLDFTEQSAPDMSQQDHVNMYPFLSDVSPITFFAMIV